MEIKELQALAEQEENSSAVSKKLYWEDVWKQVVEEKAAEYAQMEVQEVLPRLISELNYRNRRDKANSAEMGVDIRKGDICYIDYGEAAYINEIGYQHFGLILSIFHNKAFVVPMSGNAAAYRKAYSKENPKGKRHLMRLGKISGLHKNSVLFINDAKFINTARIIDVKAHLDVRSELFREIKARVIRCLE